MKREAMKDKIEINTAVCVKKVGLQWGRGLKEIERILEA
jgi:hypothetical protein